LHCCHLKKLPYSEPIASPYQFRWNVLVLSYQHYSSLAFERRRPVTTLTKLKSMEIKRVQRLSLAAMARKLGHIERLAEKPAKRRKNR